MKITVKFFASLREQVGDSETVFESPRGEFSARDIWNEVTDIELPESVLTSINMEYADIDSPVSDGDEVAFFPPVTGG